MHNPNDKLDIRALLKKKKERREQRLGIFGKVLAKCHLRIKSAASNEHTHCNFSVPKIVVGYPIYNVTDCEEYVKKNLMENGFDITQIETKEGNIIQISWGRYDKY